MQTRTQLIVLRHARETDKSTGTARIAALAIPRCTVIEFGEEAERADAALAPLTQAAWLLFPVDQVEGVPIATAAPQGGPPQSLIVLDGTWRQCRRMLKKLPSLKDVPRLALPAKSVAPIRLRESTSPDNRSTLEAIADALIVLEGEPVGAALHRLHQLMVERIFRARGVWELKAAAPYQGQ